MEECHSSPGRGLHGCQSLRVGVEVDDDVCDGVKIERPAWP